MSEENHETRIIAVENKMNSLLQAVSKKLDDGIVLYNAIMSNADTMCGLFKTDVEHAEILRQIKDELISIIKKITAFPHVGEIEKQALLKAVSRLETFSEHLEKEIKSMGEKIASVKRKSK
jgi:hypothetical protein